MQSVWMHTVLLMFCWTADLYELSVQLCRSWSRPGFSQCRCTHRSVRGGRSGQQGNILGHRTQTWSDCSQREARHPATDQSTINMILDYTNNAADFNVTFSLAVVISWLLCRTSANLTQRKHSLSDIKLPLNNFIDILTLKHITEAKFPTLIHHTLYHRISGSGFPSTTTARRDVSPMCTSTSSMMVSNLGGATKAKEVKK